jgi:type IV secretion system protein VirB1
MSVDIAALVISSALAFPPKLLVGLTAVESGHHPFAIGIVGGSLARQPRTLDEAIVTARALKQAGRNFSVG